MGRIARRSTTARLFRAVAICGVVLLGMWGCPDPGLVIDAILRSLAHAVIYDGNGAVGNVPVDGNSYAQNQAVTVLGNTGGLEKSGCGFSGWNTTADGTGTTYSPGQTFPMGTSDVTLYALWTAASFSISGTVTLDGAGLEGVRVDADSKSSLTDADGGYTISGLSSRTYPVTPSLAGYTFTPSSRSVVVFEDDVTGVDFAAGVLSGSAKWDEAKWDQDVWGD